MAKNKKIDVETFNGGELKPAISYGDKKQNNTFDMQSIGPNKLSAGISGAASIFSTAEDLASINDNYQDDIAQVGNQAFSPSSSYSLMNQFNNANWGSNKSLYDFTGKTSYDYAKGIFGSMASGAMAGTTILPGIGTIVGAGIGLLGGATGMAINQIKGAQAESRYNRELSKAQELALGNWNTARNAFSQNQFDNSLMSFYRDAAYGGLLSTHGSDFTNDIKYINAGGTHEQNPYGGVPMGVDEEGAPNLVEEGEVIVNDYVFSDRMKPSKKALENAYLDVKLYGESYAKIAEKLARPSEEMVNDAIENNTSKENLARLAGVQEEARAKKAEQEGLPANEFALGGDINGKDPNKIYKSLVGYDTNGKPIYHYLVYNQNGKPRIFTSYEAAAKKYSSIIREANVKGGYAYVDVNGKPHKSAKDAQEASEKYLRGDLKPNQKSKSSTSTNNNEVINPSVATASSARNDSSSGYIDNTGKFIPYSRNTEQEGIDFENQQYYQDFLEYMKDPSNKEFAQQWIDLINAENFGPMGGYKIKDFDDWLRLATDKKIGPVHNATLNAANNWANTELARRGIEYGDINEPIIDEGMPQVEGPLMSLMGPPDDPYKYMGTLTDENESQGKSDDDTDKESKDYSYLLRYAPVLGNALALLGNRKDYSDVNRFENMTANPRTVRFTPIGSYIRPNLVAPSELSVPIENQMAAERGYISNNSLGNSTIANNYMLASDYLGNAKIGASYLQGKQYNSEQRQKAAAYNLGIDQYNSEGAFREQQTNMALNNYYLNRALQSYNMRNNIDMAYNQAKSSNLTSLFNNLGNIGLDTFNRNRANAASPAYNYEGYDGFIKYMLDNYDNLYGKDNDNGK